jgi:hypothetical protein
MPRSERDAILLLARLLERSETISVASGDREPDAQMTDEGKGWVVAGLRLLANHRNCETLKAHGRAALSAHNEE